MTALPHGLRDWFATQRGLLNSKFRLAQRRYPTLQAEAALALVGEVLPLIVGERSEPELFASLFDLLLLHAGRGMLGPRTPGLGDSPGGRSPALGVLFREVFPKLVGLLSERPKQLPGALSNAVENLGPLGFDFARRLTTLVDRFQDGDQLLDAGAVLAWRLGDTRLRTAALEQADRLPTDLLAELLGLADWPLELVPVVVQGIHREGWVRPEVLLSEAARKSPDPARLLKQMDVWEEQVGGAWTLAARLGDFIGFEGLFAEPPVLLDPGRQGSRHRFWVRSSGTIYRLEGDVYGCVCRADGGVAYPVASSLVEVEAPLPKAISSVLVRPDLIAWTQPDSFRVRVLIRRRGLT